MVGGSTPSSLAIVGTTSNYLEVRKYELEAGKMFTPGHDASRARVAVVGPAVATLLGFDNPIALVGEQVGAVDEVPRQLREQVEERRVYWT